MEKTVEQRQQEIDRQVQEQYDKLYRDIAGEGPIEDDDPVTFEGVPVNKLDDHAKLRWITTTCIEFEKQMQTALAQYNDLQQQYHEVRGYKAQQERLCQEKLTKSMADATMGMAPTFREIENEMDCKAGLHVRKEPEPKPAESPELENV